MEAACPWFPNSGCAAANGCLVILSVDASDPDGDNLIYNYTVSGGKINNEGARASWNLSDLPPATYNVEVEVTDNRGGRVAQSVSVEVVPHGACDPPCTSIVVTCPDEVEEGGTVIFTANVSGVEANVTPSFSWSVSGGKIVRGQGTHTIEVDKTDTGGRVVEATVDIGGLAPECSRSASCKVNVRKKTEKGRP